MKIWTCKIGEADEADVPHGGDAPMRDAVARRYERITGSEPDFIFSGWGGELTEQERAVHEDRPPDPDAFAYPNAAALATDLELARRDLTATRQEMPDQPTVLEALLAIQSRAYLDDDEDSREGLVKRLNEIYDMAGAWAEVLKVVQRKESGDRD